MSPMRLWFARLFGIFGRKASDERLQKELEAHFEMLVEENVRRGMSSAEARQAARVPGGKRMLAVGAVQDPLEFPAAILALKEREKLTARARARPCDSRIGCRECPGRKAG